jgi:hypothetical protein
MIASSAPQSVPGVVDDRLHISLRPPLRWRPVMGFAAVWLILIGLYQLAVPAPPRATLPQKAAHATAVSAGEEAYSMPPRADWVAAMRQQLQPLQSLAAPMPRPRPGDWLAEHHEPGQSFGDFWRTYTVRPTPRRHTIVVQPLGDFTSEQQRVIALTADYLESYFHLPVRMQSALPLEAIPRSAFRYHPRQGMLQIHTDTVLEEVLVPRLPADAVVYLAFTAIDLFPDPSWNFVFGQASLTHRVGVWSLARNGDPSLGQDSFRLCLLRTIKVDSTVRTPFRGRARTAREIGDQASWAG